MAGLLQLKGCAVSVSQSLYHSGMRRAPSMVSQSVRNGAGRLAAAARGSATHRCTSQPMAAFCSSSATKSHNSTVWGTLRPLLTKQAKSLRTFCRQYHDHGRMDWRDMALHKKKPFEINTNVPENVLVFINKSGGLHYKVVGFGSMSMCIFMFMAANDVYTSFGQSWEGKAEALEKSGKAWYARVITIQHHYKGVISALCILVGCVFFTYGFLTPRRAIQKLYLLKGGKSVRFVTYTKTPKSAHSFDVPLEHITCKLSRSAPNKSLAVQVKGRRSLFQLDKEKGKFLEGQLFDQVIGIKRKI